MAVIRVRAEEVRSCEWSSDAQHNNYNLYLLWRLPLHSTSFTLFADFSLLSIKLQIPFRRLGIYRISEWFKIKSSESSNIKYHKIIILTKVSSVFILVEDFRRIFLFLQKLGYSICDN